MVSGRVTSKYYYKQCTSSEQIKLSVLNDLHQGDIVNGGKYLNSGLKLSLLEKLEKRFRKQLIICFNWSTWEQWDRVVKVYKKMYQAFKKLDI